MELEFILSIIVLAVALFFGLRILKSVLMALLAVVLLAVLLIGGAGYLAWHDAQDLRENFSNSTKLMLLADEKGLVFGLEVTTLDMEGKKVIGYGTLDSWQDDYGDGKYKRILGERDMLLIFKDKAFDEEVDSVEEMGILLKGYFSRKNVLFLLQEYKEGTIIVYPESLLFRLIKLIPNRVMDSVAEYVGKGVQLKQPSSTAVIQSLAADTPKIIEVSNADEIGVSQIELEVKSKLSDVEITVAKLAEQPASVATIASATVYRYLDVTTKKITSDDIKNVKFDFKVEKSWLAEEAVTAKEIVLLRYADDKWNELATQQVKSDATYVYYTADSPGFSVFAIATTAESTGNPAKGFFQSALFTIAVGTVLAVTGIGFIYKNRLVAGAKIDDLLGKLKRSREERLKK